MSEHRQDYVGVKAGEVCEYWEDNGKGGLVSSSAEERRQDFIECRVHDVYAGRDNAPVPIHQARGVRVSVCLEPTFHCQPDDRLPVEVAIPHEFNPRAACPSLVLTGAQAVEAYKGIQAYLELPVEAPPPKVHADWYVEQRRKEKERDAALERAGLADKVGTMLREVETLVGLLREHDDLTGDAGRSYPDKEDHMACVSYATRRLRWILDGVRNNDMKMRMLADPTRHVEQAAE